MTNLQWMETLELAGLIEVIDGMEVPSISGIRKLEDSFIKSVGGEIAVKKGIENIIMEAYNEMREAYNEKMKAFNEMNPDYKPTIVVREDGTVDYF